MRSALCEAVDLKEKLHRQRWVVPLDDSTIEDQLPPGICERCKRGEVVLKFSKSSDGKEGEALGLFCEVCGKR
ncbi:hypothetical protein TrRE_jg8 [Triparma retinervis]|uniref:TFIIS-type domain-containing protein n=1 Tax=Triparma retinervis TaxID=2557542 RepID=A0A9W7ABE9_9STRA|nr:hypothetical protein TrRE_jg8 [Triparma retinervis]